MFAVSYFGSCLTSIAASLACGACQCVSREIMKSSARLSFSILFFLSMIVAWVMRDFAKPMMEKIPWIVQREMDFHPTDKWFGQQAVYRISMGSFLYFIGMSAALVGVRMRSDKRDRHLHHGHWLVKVLLWLLCIALPFLFPNQLVEAYGSVARFGSGLFLMIQMIILLDCVQSMNDAWVNAGDEHSGWLYGLLALTIAAYGGAITIAGLLYHWFAPSSSACSLNIAFITVALLLCVVFSLLALTPYSAGGSIFPAACISLYCMYLTFSALESEPATYACNTLGHKLTAASGSSLALGLVITIASVVYAALRAGSNNNLFMLDLDSGEGNKAALLEGDEEHGATSAGLDGVPDQQDADRSGTPKPASAMTDYQPVSYNYSFFHLIFALASMYVAMLLSGWGSYVQDKARLDVGWTSVWVKAVSGWVTAAIYIWTLIAPIMFPDREFV